VAGTLIAFTICGAFLADGRVAVDDPDADPVADVLPCGEPEWFWCKSTTVAAPAPAPIIARAAMAIFHPAPERLRWGVSYPVPDQGAGPGG